MEGNKETDIEQRKAAALKDFDFAMSCLSDWRRNEWFKKYKDELHDLLAPSPQAPDNEVDEAIETVQRCLDIGRQSPMQFSRNLMETLIRAAKHPHQEWRTMERANDAIDAQLVIDRDISDHAQLSDKDKHYTLGYISGLMLAKTALRPLPSPPEEEP